MSCFEETDPHQIIIQEYRQACKLAADLEQREKDRRGEIREKLTLLADSAWAHAQAAERDPTYSDSDTAAFMAVAGHAWAALLAEPE